MQFSFPAASFNLYIKNDTKRICVHLFKTSPSPFKLKNDLAQRITKSPLCRNTMRNELQILPAWKIVNLDIVFPYDPGWGFYL